MGPSWSWRTTHHTTIIGGYLRLRLQLFLFSRPPINSSRFPPTSGTPIRSGIQPRMEMINW